MGEMGGVKCNWFWVDGDTQEFLSQNWNFYHKPSGYHWGPPLPIELDPRVLSGFQVVFHADVDG